MDTYGVRAIHPPPERGGFPRNRLRSLTVLNPSPRESPRFSHGEESGYGYSTVATRKDLREQASHKAGNATRPALYLPGLKAEVSRAN